VLYFSKLRIISVALISFFFIFIASSNLLDSENSLISKRINLGLDLQGGSYLLLEIDNEPVEIQKLQNKISIIRNYLNDKKIKFTDLKIENKAIFFVVNEKDKEIVKSFFFRGRE
jgi:preprotein translocase subunit SecD